VKLRSLFVLAAGVAIGYRLSQKMHEDDPNVVRGPQQRPSSQSSTALLLVQGQAQKLADQASMRSVQVIRRARGAIRDRLGETTGDDAAWN
jgi:hypothetical protein